MIKNRILLEELNNFYVFLRGGHANRSLLLELKSSAKEHQSHKLILKTIATHPDYQNQKIGTIMVNLIHNQVYEIGFDQVIHAMMFSGNITSKVGSKKFNTKVLRTYSLMKKEL